MTGKLHGIFQNTEKGYEMIYENHGDRNIEKYHYFKLPYLRKKTNHGEENEERCEQKELLDKIEKLNDRHQSDCIKINQLNVVIDVLVEKYARLREVHGL